MKVFITVVALGLAPITALAADLGLRKSYLPGADTPAPSASPWTGAYAGVNAGGGFGRVTDPRVAPVTGALKSGGVLGGVQVGYNQQVGGFVLGLEADYAMAHVKGSVVASAPALGMIGTATAESKLDSLGTVRARAGVALNSALLFATGGWAYGNNKVTLSGSSFAAVSDSQWMSGWTLGGGVEYAFMQNMTAKLEYLYADLGKTTFYKGQWAQNEISNKVNIIRAGVNYRF